VEFIDLKAQQADDDALAERMGEIRVHG